MRSLYKTFLFGAVLSMASPMVANSSFRAVSWNPPKIVNGSPCLFKVQLTNAATTVNGKWQGHELTFVPSPDGKTWYALAGVNVDTKPGAYKLELQATLESGVVAEFARSVNVERANYPSEELHVPERYVKPDPETMVRIEEDQKLKRAAFSHEEGVEWSGQFQPPIDTTVSEGFGTRRTFNGQLASIHRGLDYHAAPGTPILASNSGEVVLARELFYEGNCVIIDHGFGFSTIYMHFSRLEVSEGQKVKKGQELGLSGATGRVTGPHLHVAVRWQGEYLNPAQLWTLPLPDLHPTTVAGKKQPAPGNWRSEPTTQPEN